jgi:hypothetical protein
MQRRCGTRARLSPAQTACVARQRAACWQRGVMLPVGPLPLLLLLLLVAQEPAC